MSTAITPQMVKQLRDRTDQPMGLCKQALDQSGGDMEKAIEWLRSQNSKMGVKREGNETAEGRIGTFVDNAAKVGAIVEMRCESAPSAKSDQFIALAAAMANHVAAKNPANVDAALTQPFVGGSGTVQDRIHDVVGVIREKMVLQRFQRLEGGVYGSYVHHDGTVGVLLECKGGPPNDEVLRDVATHIAALNPPYTITADVPADVIAREKELVMQEITADPKNAGKPANILEKISEGKLKTRLAEIVLTEQQMANVGKYPSTTVGAALKKAGLEPVKFIRFKVGAVTL
jgi:elongation factor Ts